MAGLPDYFENMNHAELAKVRGKDQRLSTRDKERLLKKVAEIKSVATKLGEKLFIGKV